MEEYRVRSKERIERLANLISLSCSAMTLLTVMKPFPDISPPALRKVGTKLASKSRRIYFCAVSGNFSKLLKIVLRQ